MLFRCCRVAEDDREDHVKYIADESDLLLGQGTYGSVYLERRASGNPVAVKYIKTTNRFTRDRALREVYLQSRMHHPNIAAVLEVHVGRTVRIVQEFAGYQTLLDLMCDPPKTRDRGLCDSYARGIADALVHMHSHGVCHLDIKPENVGVEDSHVRLFDFGMSREVDPMTHLRETSGTVAYAAPEILADRPYHGTPADLWSFGVLYFALLYKCMPFDKACSSCKAFRAFHFAQEYRNQSVEDSIASAYASTSFLTRGDVTPTHRRVLEAVLQTHPDRRSRIDQVRTLLPA
jgi:serine/threonine protein kinase